MNILILNAGSSSLKYQLINMTNETIVAKGNCEKIGSKTSFLKHKVNGQEIVLNEYIQNHEKAIELMINSLLSKEYGCIKNLNDISAIGHRVLHGGEIYKKSVIINDEVLSNLESLKILGPLHMPANISGIRACQIIMPNVKQVAVFDTAFHANMPPEAFLYAIPYEAYTDWKIRKYGFHGTSHRYVSAEMAKILNKDIKDCKIITIHLGNGSSMAAVKGGISIDTTMGYTPLEGLMMGTRSGDIDPSVIEILMEKLNLDIKGAINFLNKKCGILGINGVSHDMRDNQEEVKKGNERAKLVPKMLGYRIKKYIGAYLAALNGADAIVFTGGIGERDPNVRYETLKGLESLGIELDVDKNFSVKHGTVENLSASSSKILIYRIPTDEEMIIAHDTYDLLK